MKEHVATRFDLRAHEVELTGYVAQEPSEEMIQSPFKIILIVDGTKQKHIDEFSLYLNARQWICAPHAAKVEQESGWTFEHLRYRNKFFWNVKNSGEAFLLIAELVAILDSYKAPDS